ncbi:MarR family transcriptional regulator [uncultured Slackia sp.]|uniref:MarR family transcriptional regulator n=1 Tax=uncultured Slackia sp. TaxID=665903 RepID=UPI0026E0691C|nr:MarR family transcriptional regulator [uncultured Slackia sp.]
MSPRKENLSLDSAYFVAFEMTHDALKRGLKAASELNITQYRMLVKLAAAGAPIAQSELSGMLGLRPNVVTQAVNALEEARFAKREVGTGDGRARMVEATEAGIAHVGVANESIVAQLYALFPTEDAAWRAILETSITAGSFIDPPISERETACYPASRALASLERFRSAIEAGLRDACGASYNECRVMQRLAETGRPMRIGDIAAQLQLSPVNVARAADRLAARSWVRRMGAAHDRKAVFVEVTEAGAKQQRVIARTVDDLGRKLLWKHLKRPQRDAIRAVTDTVIEGLRERERRKDLAVAENLRPIG